MDWVVIGLSLIVSRPLDNTIVIIMDKFWWVKYVSKVILIDPERKNAPKIEWFNVNMYVHGGYEDDRTTTEFFYDLSMDKYRVHIMRKSIIVIVRSLMKHLLSSFNCGFMRSLSFKNLSIIVFIYYYLLPRVSPWSIARKNWITLLYPSYIKSSAEVSVVVVINWGRSVHSPARRPRHRIHQHAMWTSRVQDHKDNEEHCTECETLFQDTHLNHDWQWVLLRILIVTWWFGCWLKSTEWL